MDLKDLKKLEHVMASRGSWHAPVWHQEVPMTVREVEQLALEVALNSLGRPELREELSLGGQWLGAARNWILWKKDPHGRLTWGSTNPIRLSFKELEELALEAAIAAVERDGPEIDRKKEREKKMLEEFKERESLP